jgi:hypothetical protein
MDTNESQVSTTETQGPRSRTFKEGLRSLGVLYVSCYELDRNSCPFVSIRGLSLSAFICG